MFWSNLRKFRSYFSMKTISRINNKNLMIKLLGFLSKWCCGQFGKRVGCQRVKRCPQSGMGSWKRRILYTFNGRSRCAITCKTRVSWNSSLANHEHSRVVRWKGRWSDRVHWRWCTKRLWFASLYFLGIQTTERQNRTQWTTQLEKVIFFLSKLWNFILDIYKYFLYSFRTLDNRVKTSTLEFMQKYNFANVEFGNFYQGQYDEYVEILNAQMSG